MDPRWYFPKDVRLSVLVCILLLNFLAGVKCQKYMGCYKESSTQSRLLSDLKTNLKSTLTVEVCAEHCKEKGFRYSGVEWRYECFCSNDRPTFKQRASESECNLPCDGNSNQICGGNLRINVYDLGDDGDRSDPVFNFSLGCFNDPPNERMFKGEKLETPYLTPEFCVGICYRKGYRMAALQGGSECLCGDALNQQRKITNSECTSECSGEEALICGGTGKSSIYLTGIPDSPLDDDGFLGCYREDGLDKRILSGIRIELKQTNSPKRCMNICLTLGYKYSGTEYGFECFCGNRKPLPEKETEENQCQMLCSGNKNEHCGGVWRLLVHTTGYGKVIPSFPELSKRKPQPTRPTQTKKPLVNNQATPATTTKRPKPTPAPESATIKPPSKNCESTPTTYNGGRKACKGQLLFREDFNGDKLDHLKWGHRIFMPWTPDYDFVTFNDKPANSYLKNGKLIIKPTLQDNNFVRTGKIELQNCTGEEYSGECVRQAATFSILPPIESARIYSKEFFAFQYGVVHIRAKLPVGDWIIPELWLEPKRRKYGVAYSSGRIRIAMARGNKNLISGDEDIGNQHLESGILMGIGLDEGIRGRTVIRAKEGGWHTQFYNFTLIWSPDNLRFLVDGNSELDLIPPEGGTLCELVGFTNEECATWKSGSSLAPFDNELYISLGLTVGGMRDFPDDSMSNSVKKPWTNLNVKAMVNFWQAREKWKSTWDDENSILQVDNVRVYAL